MYLASFPIFGVSNHPTTGQADLLFAGILLWMVVIISPINRLIFYVSGLVFIKKQGIEISFVFAGLNPLNFKWVNPNAVTFTSAVAVLPWKPARINITLILQTPL